MFSEWKRQLLGRRRLRTRLLLPSLVVGIFLTGLALARAFELRAAQEREQQQTALQLVTVAARSIDATVAQAQTLLQSLGNSLDPLAPPGRNDAVLRALFHDAPVPFSRIWIADSSGNNRGAAPFAGDSRDTLAVATEKAFLRARDQKGFAIGDVQPESAEPGARLVLTFALPVVNTVTGRVTSVVGAILPIDSLDAVRTVRTLPTGSVLAVMDSSGAIVLRTEDARNWIGRSFAKDGRFRKNFARGVGVGATKSADGTDRLTGYILTERQPWMVYIGIPARYTVDVARAQFARDLVLGAVITLLVLGVGYALALRLVSPIESLTKDASAIAGGDLARRSTVTSDDEIGDLARAFNSMADTIAERDAALRTSQEQLLHSQKMEALGSFAGGIAHDFNNYLAAIVGHAELAALALPEGDPAREDIAEVLASSARAADLTRQILIFSRKQVVEPHIIDLSAVVRGIERLLRRLLGEDRVLQLECTDVPAPVFMDHGQLEQVIVNLVANARDATPHGGVIRVSTSVSQAEARIGDLGAYEEPTHVRLIVSDNGSGIAPDVRDRIFDPFFSTKARGQGTGLGLAIAYGIVQQSRGEITVDSEIGVGTTFSVLLPLTQEENAQGKATDEDTLVTGYGRILIAEDDEAVRNSTARALQRAGYDVVSAEDGMTALRHLRNRQSPFDLLLSDVVMPGMSGSALAKRARALQPGLAVLFMSGYADDDGVRDGLATGIISCIPKPFTAAELCAAVRRTILQRSAPVATM
jgi:signal transduction histidine kinase/ActR/RegA family two-component response regulator